MTARAYEDWVRDARCRSAVFEAPVLLDFFAELGDGRTKTEVRAAWRRAKAICMECPVRELCFEWAVRTRETYGVWGGTDPVERGRITRGFDRARKSAKRGESDELVG